MKITFIPLSEEIMDYKTKWLNNANVSQYLYGKISQQRTTLKEQKDWFLKYSQDQSKHFFTILIDQKVVGMVGLKGINQSENVAEIFILIGAENYWNKGVGTYAMNFIIDYAQNNLKLEELNLSVHKDNKYAVKLFTKFGFKKSRSSIVEIEMKKMTGN